MARRKKTDTVLIKEETNKNENSEREPVLKSQETSVSEQKESVPDSVKAKEEPKKIYIEDKTVQHDEKKVIVDESVRIKDFETLYPGYSEQLMRLIQSGKIQTFWSKTKGYFVHSNEVTQAVKILKKIKG